MDRSDPVAALRRFNRFYTRRIGVLHERPLDGAFTLAQTRLLWELAHRDGLTAALLARELDLDPGYLSRLLRSLRERGLLRTTRSKTDGREALLALTAAGRRAFAPLDQRSQQDMQTLLEPLREADQHRLVEAATTIEDLLSQDRTPASGIELRDDLRPGDLGWLVSRHGALYAHEYGWDMRFEALVAHIAARFVERYEPSLERAWIAERGATPLGCIFLVQCRDEQTDAPLPGIAQLRLLLVEPSARGSGLGRRLVAECTRFARAAGYRRIRLWTQSILSAARTIYQKEGYRLVATEPHDSFGHQLIGEIWELAL